MCVVSCDAKASVLFILIVILVFIVVSRLDLNMYLIALIVAVNVNNAILRLIFEVGLI